MGRAQTDEEEQRQSHLIERGELLDAVQHLNSVKIMNPDDFDMLVDKNGVLFIAFT